MTLNEQIMKLQTYKMFEGEDTVYVERDDVLKLLEQKPCEDCISRKDVNETLRKCWLNGTVAYRIVDELKQKIDDLPSVQTKQKTGHWIKTKEQNDAEPLILWKCSECLTVQRLKTNYCPNCGAKMEEQK